jgi:AcrR family transcriptional regulator
MIDAMPRVSEAHLASRRRQILEAARACFARNGFHATSMQEVIREAGLSVGAVYRYFPSKNDLVTALAEEVIHDVTDAFEEILSADPPLPLAEAMARAVDVIEPKTGPDGVLRLAIQVWAEALRDPALAAFVERVYKQMRDVFVALARRAIETGELPAGTDPAAVGSVLFATMPGYALQRILLREPEPAAYQAGLAALLPGAADSTDSTDSANSANSTDSARAPVPPRQSA